jgi:ribonuclease VapC
MIVDSSALIAIVRGEPEAEDFAQLLLSTDVCSIAAPTYVESAIFPDCDKNPLLRLRFDELLGEFEVRIEPFTEQHARIAREAYRDYGKGSGHPAQLNLGDCSAMPSHGRPASSCCSKATTSLIPTFARLIGRRSERR